MNLVPLSNKILFQFSEEVVDRRFSEKTKSGITIVSLNEHQVKEARWAKVIAKGDNVSDEDVRIGQFVLIEPLMWTNKVTLDDQFCWMTSIDKILVVSDEDLSYQ